MAECFVNSITSKENREHPTKTTKARHLPTLARGELYKVRSFALDSAVPTHCSPVPTAPLYVLFRVPTVRVPVWSA